LAVAMTKMSLLSAMASAVIARHEAIQWTDNKQIAKHVIGRNEAIQRADNRQITKHVTGRSVATRQSGDAGQPSKGCQKDTGLEPFRPPSGFIRILFTGHACGVRHDATV
ncbi:MAG: hypothetical protein LBF85_08575, partial [Tannerella sp.]|nr:hypothetical protein [Tannerella sp.]